MIVVADASPLRYLVLIDEVEILSGIYGCVLIPPAVKKELTQPRTPEVVRRWIVESPKWLEVRTPRPPQPEFPATLGAGEQEAIVLAEQARADALLIDDWAGRQEAKRRKLNVVGTLRILSSAAEEGLIDLPAAIARLRMTNFRASEELIQFMLDEHSKIREK
jgi:predicted nucleic acid-binding protein